MHGTGASASQEMAAKAVLRAQVVERLKALDPASRAAASESAGAALLALLHRELSPGSPVAVFAPMPTEIGFGSHFAEIAHTFQLAYPRVEDGTLAFRACDESALVPVPGSKLREPPGDAPEVVPHAVVVPGRAFDLRGARLGRGRGYYDRALASAGSALLLGYCHATQVVDRVPELAHDRRVQWLVTDEGARRCA